MNRRRVRQHVQQVFRTTSRMTPALIVILTGVLFSLLSSPHSSSIMRSERYVSTYKATQVSRIARHTRRCSSHGANVTSGRNARTLSGSTPSMASRNRTSS